ncbi:Hypothetical protein NTJ_09722 [Nesidiocoris tenuis]|uniref:Uncharacterized protein n=1 Tax=Nesidiocoris tenuis TaxID=355587 RepID=A0ABN7AXK2_9HEMI|nr:Hypothetical protein NTJ_09722 [Nesidiocoris tenuis]
MVRKVIDVCTPFCSLTPGGSGNTMALQANPVSGRRLFAQQKARRVHQGKRSEYYGSLCHHKGPSGADPRQDAKSVVTD